MEENTTLTINYIEDGQNVTYTRLYPSKEQFVIDHQEIFDLCYGEGNWRVE